jgi:hypothetical protein
VEFLRVSGYYVEEEGLYMFAEPITDAGRLPLDPFPGVYGVNRGRRGESRKKKETSAAYHNTRLRPSGVCTFSKRRWDELILTKRLRGLTIASRRMAISPHQQD